MIGCRDRRFNYRSCLSTSLLETFFEIVEAG